MLTLKNKIEQQRFGEQQLEEIKGNRCRARLESYEESDIRSS